MRHFEDYLNEKIINKCVINHSKVKYFLEETERSYRGLLKRIEVMGIDEDNTNSIIKDCYDILMELIRAKLLLSGYSSSGNYAHEAEISFLRNCHFSENEILFMNELRSSRNSITYYGKLLNKEYAEKVVKFTKNIYIELKKKIQDEAIKYYKK